MATGTRFNGFEAQHPVIYINSESQTGDEGMLPLGMTESVIQYDTRSGQPEIMFCST